MLTIKCYRPTGFVEINTLSNDGTNPSGIDMEFNYEGARLIVRLDKEPALFLAEQIRDIFSHAWPVPGGKAATEE